MRRCLELAGLGAGAVAPNPMVGAVLVHNDRIIGEGWHQRYGEAHAEVNCMEEAIRQGFTDLIPRSTLFVSLEPCAHYGKTPPCADRIIREKVPQVVIGCRDPFKEVDGKGIEKLKAAGIRVETGVLEKECRDLNKRFFTFHTRHRPYVILKWAQTQDGLIASRGQERLLISNEFSNRLVHQWRSEEAAVLVGTNTALLDDPHLTTRLWPGHNPVRLVIDLNLRLPVSLNLFNREARTVIFNQLKQEEAGDLLYYKLAHDQGLVPQVLEALYRMNLQSVLVEGGATLLQSFIDEGLWDEARVITNNTLHIREGLAAPRFEQAVKFEENLLGSDTVELFKPALV